MLASAVRYPVNSSAASTPCSSPVVPLKIVSVPLGDAEVVVFSVTALTAVRSVLDDGMNSVVEPFEVVIDWRGGWWMSDGLVVISASAVVRIWRVERRAGASRLLRM